jgi:GNAT superfamily N-acetyltransferase
MFKLRAAAESDYDFIVKYWLDSAKVNTWLGQNVRARYYGKHHKELIECALRRFKTIVVEDDKEVGHLLGFINYAPTKNYLNYVYVKKNFRGNGIGSGLIKMAVNNSTVLQVSHECKLPSIGVEYHFNPYPFLEGD